MRRWHFSWILVFFSLAGCASFHEEHYFQTSDSAGTPVNYFRIKVDGNGGFTRMRYLSGYYDERAVDLYFNEVKSAPAGGSNFDIQPLFAASQVIPGTQEILKPLDPTNHGALLMIFSSNPNAIADAIGQFAENQQIADALTNIVNKDEVKEQREVAKTLNAKKSRFTASAAELQALFSPIPQNKSTVTAADRDKFKAIYLNALRSIAITLGGDGKFEDFEQAQSWINGKRSELP